MHTLSAFKGMDNRHRAEVLPEGFLRNTVNVEFDQQGKAQRIQGVTKLYSGTGIHSYWSGYFVQQGSLKYIDANNSVTTITVVADKQAGYCYIGDQVVFGNGVDSLILDGTSFEPLGVPVPTTQCTATASSGGDMYEGDYHLTFTYLRNGQESGALKSVKLSVHEGGGINVQLPTPPSGVDGVALYVSEVNSTELYLFNDFASTSGALSVYRKTGSYRLESQFMYPPVLTSIMSAHYGRIYWAEGDVLRWTEPQRYGYTKPGNYARFGGAITNIVPLPGVLYVTADKTYLLNGIDAPGEAFMQRREVLPYGAVPGAVHYDLRAETAYWQSDRGIVAATSDEVKELVLDNIAMPSYTSGTLTMLERNGVRQLIVVSQGGAPSPLMDSTFKAEEITRKGNAL